ncbi:hypothetical protein HNP86_002020 [Methanococcus maripaludis]|uniref:Uncharacterized protein n=1 Tax=Methanococcus maripaludis TaxID=39152 RepID=A0A7J9NX36_METMI|nr:hypothetical protein [Methanococcus maripaludis]MBA2851861.1 hypothetical protein [Methanococcus maripaludis]
MAAYKDLVDIAESNPEKKYYIYVTLNSRDYSKAWNTFIHTAVDIAHVLDKDKFAKNRLKDVGGIYESCLLQEDSIGTANKLYFLLDVDAKSQWLLNKVVDVLGTAIVVVRPTPNGYHAVLERSAGFERIQGLLHKYMSDDLFYNRITLHKDGLLFVRSVNMGDTHGIEIQ